MVAVGALEENECPCFLKDAPESYGEIIRYGQLNG